MYAITSAILAAALVVAGCSSDDKKDPCPFKGGSLSCKQAAEKSNGSDGLCSYSVTASELANACNSWPSAEFRNCWTTCIEKATTCAVATACENDCDGCGR